MELKEILETLIFISGRVLATSEMMEILKEVSDGPHPHRQELEAALEALQKEWDEKKAGMTLVAVAEGYEFRSRPEAAPWIKAFNQSKPQRLSFPAVETLSMIAYRQPVTRSDIETIRGVDSGGVLKNLLEHRLIRIVGRKEEPGRPILYATSTEFLEMFGLNGLSDLPPLSELEELIKSQAVAPPESNVISMSDLLMTPEEIGSLEEDDRKALEELDQSLKNLKQVERSVIESSSEPSEVSVVDSIPEELEEKTVAEP